MSNLFSRRVATEFIVVHCTATPPLMDIGLAEVRRWHREKGWIDVGYHFIIRRDGTVELGRPVDTIGAHVAGHNHNSIGISLVGGIDKNGHPENNFMAAQFEALEALIIMLQNKYPHTKVQGHRDFPGVAKACPSFDAIDWWKGVQLAQAPKASLKTVEVSERLTTYWAISRHYKVDLFDLMDANPDKPAFALKLGDVINLPY